VKDRCKRLGQIPLPQNEEQFFGFSQFEAGLRSFANTFVQLQELRHRSDYDPDYKLTKAQAQEAVDGAKLAVTNLTAANADQKNQFLAYLLFALRPL
jgi:hypothetical protein